MIEKEKKMVRKNNSPHTFTSKNEPLSLKKGTSSHPKKVSFLLMIRFQKMLFVCSGKKSVERVIETGRVTTTGLKWSISGSFSIFRSEVGTWIVYIDQWTDDSVLTWIKHQGDSQTIRVSDSEKTSNPSGAVRSRVQQSGSH